MSPANKQKFVNYITNQEFYKQLLNVDIDPNQSKTLFNGDVLVSITEEHKDNKSNITNFALLSDVCEHDVVETFTGGILGIDVISFRMEMTYIHNDNEVLTLTDYSTFTTRCWLPCSISYINEDAYIDNSVKRAYYECDQQFYFTWQELGMLVGAGHTGIWGDCDCVHGCWGYFYED